MKLTLLLFFTFVVATMGKNPKDMQYERMVEGIANFLEMTKDEARTCFIEKGITLDMIKFDTRRRNNLQSPDLHDINLKIGCLFACLGQKKEMMTDAHLNVGKIKKMMDSKDGKPSPEDLAKLYQYVDLCANQVKTITDECKVAATFVLCMDS
ncbi:uncharacterized protein LOC116853060 isoform X2 [Odontomachus brunneus]|uniref:uncharacterized protein LOC116853060 isoform X2 n=1 Tax=Odontomachus brunneus TaxID=486640 RepID=UPI0013F28937|nr:uncharacterized protein LOC116853060 isoform X2 [Odontomachus brunneus]